MPNDLITALSIVGFVFGSLCWLGGYFTGRDKEQRMNQQPFYGDEPSKYNYPDGFIEKGRVYVVSGFTHVGREVGISLTGKRCLLRCHQEIGWAAPRFRKLDHLKAESRERYYKEHPELQPSNL